MSQVMIVDNDPDILVSNERLLGYILTRAHQQYRQRMALAIEGTTLNVSQVMILARVHAHSQNREESYLTQTRLSHITGIEKSSMVLFLDSLVKGYWVERLRHPTDRRAQVIRMTPSGAARFREINVRLKMVEQESLSLFTDAERDHLFRQLLRLTQHLQQLETVTTD